MSTNGSQEPFDTAKSALEARARLIIGRLATGRSRARRSTAPEIVDEIGCETLDGSAAVVCHGAAIEGVAIRVGAGMPTSSLFAETSLDLRARAAVDCRCQLRPMVIDSDDDQLERRYTEAQRSHLPAGDRLLIDGTRPKRQMLSALRDRADLLIETSPPPATEHERPMASECVLAKCGMRAFVTSFAYGCRSPRSVEDELFLGHSLGLEVSRAPDGGASAIPDCAGKDRGAFLKIAVGRPKADSTRPCVPAAAAKPREAGWRMWIRSSNLPMRAQGSPADGRTSRAATD